MCDDEDRDISKKDEEDEQAEESPARDEKDDEWDQKLFDPRNCRRYRSSPRKLDDDDQSDE